MTSQIVRTLYKKLLALYPPTFREQLGESMTQTFDDLYNEHKQQTGSGMFGFVLWLFVDTGKGIIKEHIRLTRQGHTMNNFFASPRSTAITSFILAFPFALILSLLVLGIEPPLGPLEPLLRVPPDQPAILGTAIVLGALLLSLVALIVNLRLIVRLMRTGNSLTAYPINLLLAVVISFFILFFVAAIIIDQYPCWIGVPNCD